MMTRLRSTAATCIALVLMVLPSRVAQARVVRVVVDTRHPIGNGHVVGDGGAYERITGRIYIALDPHIRTTLASSISHSRRRSRRVRPLGWRR